MRPVAGLLACLCGATLTSALANPPPSTTPADKPAVDADVQHFLAEGYKPEMRGGKEVYCRKETEIGTRLGGKTVCDTLEHLRVKEQQAQNNVHQSQGH